ncbi:MAG: 2OG-Fe(II) oxygenase [Proteobacteria bacterium]|nr:2OG-Fe(II) oxygenase [Pseudomonadota bacterium]
MTCLDWDAIEQTSLERQPFDHFIVPQVLTETCSAAIPREFPTIGSPGSFSLDDVRPGPVLARLIAELLSERFRRRMEGLFDVDLADRPAVVTLRGQASGRDGRIHTDSRSKLLSLLLYLNEEWRSPDGQLRLLRGPRGLDDYAVEAPPTMGRLLGFRRTDDSWHGHTQFVGQRRVLQLNYLRSERASLVGNLRHRLSALGKRRVA